MNFGFINGFGVRLYACAVLGWILNFKLEEMRVEIWYLDNLCWIYCSGHELLINFGILQMIKWLFRLMVGLWWNYCKSGWIPLFQTGYGFGTESEPSFEKDASWRKLSIFYSNLMREIEISLVILKMKITRWFQDFSEWPSEVLFSEPCKGIIDFNQT